MLIDFYRPSAILLQCGADSLVGDLLGCFNLSTKGHGECVDFVRSFGIPLLVCGGGGYIKQSVARCWTYETSILVNQEIPDNLPETDYLEYFQPTYKLHLTPDKRKNMNDPRFLENLHEHVTENIRHLNAAPSVQMAELPPRAYIQKPIRRMPETSAVCRRLFERISLNVGADDEAERRDAEEERLMGEAQYEEAVRLEPNPNVPKPEEKEDVDTV